MSFQGHRQIHRPRVSGDWSIYPSPLKGLTTHSTRPGWDKGDVCSQGTGKCRPLQPDVSPGLTSENTMASFMHGMCRSRCGVRASFGGDGHVLELVVCSPNIECTESHWTVRCKVVRM